MKLSKEAFGRASNYINEFGRPLEVARFAYHFEGGPAGAVVGELKAFQNEDGGFGHALEPDMRTPESSALATSVAFQMIRELPGDAVVELVQPAFNYLVQTFDTSKATWRIIPPAAASSPHAPWWSQAGETDRFANFSLNPTAELLGYIIEFSSDISPASFVSNLSNKVLAHILQLDEIEAHEYQCCIRLSQTPNLPSEYRERLIDKLVSLMAGVVALDSTAWSGYALLPLQVADSPESPFYASLEGIIGANLNFEIGNQDDDGSWWPLWSWGDNFADVWPVAQKEWAGYLTLAKLLTCKNYGVIEGFDSFLWV